jgi:hypothetical protein
VLEAAVLRKVALLVGAAVGECAVQRTTVAIGLQECAEDAQAGGSRAEVCIDVET